MTAPSPAARLNEFVARYTTEVAALGRAVLARLRRRLPPAIEMVYDNYNFLVVGFSPTDRPSDAVFSVVFAPRRVSLCFVHGARLPDPHHLLAGGGNQVRFVRLPTAAALDDPRLRALIAVALRSAPTPFDGSIRRRQLVIRSVSARQRPRRPAPAKNKRH